MPCVFDTAKKMMHCFAYRRLPPSFSHQDWFGASKNISLLSETNSTANAIYNTQSSTASAACGTCSNYSMHPRKHPDHFSILRDTLGFSFQNTLFNSFCLLYCYFTIILLLFYYYFVYFTAIWLQHYEIEIAVHNSVWECICREAILASLIDTCKQWRQME